MAISASDFLDVLEGSKLQSFDEHGEAYPLDDAAFVQNINGLAGFIGGHLELRDDVTIEETDLGGVRALLVKPLEKAERVVLALHCGWYVLPLDSLGIVQKNFSAELAHAGKAEVYVLDYRVAPDNPYPAALEDAYLAYMTLLERGFKAKDIFIEGDSAGGGLALALLLRLRDEKKPMPAGALTTSAWTDLACTGESVESRADMDPMNIPAQMRGFVKYYVKGQSVLDPYISPLYGDFTGIPPLMLLVGGREIVYDDSYRLAEKAKAANVDVTLDLVEDMIHIYPLFVGVFPEAKSAIKRMAAFMENHQKSQ